MKTIRYEKNRSSLLNDLTLVASKLGKNIKLHGRQYIILATAASMIMAYTVALIGCKSTGKPNKNNAEQWQYMKHKSRSSGSQ